MSAQFPTQKFRHVASGATVEGQIVVETSTAWQVAVEGKVRSLRKGEFQPEPTYVGGFGDLFGMFKNSGL